MSTSASAKNTLTSLLLTKQTLQMADTKENACYTVLMRNHLEFMTKTIYILGNRNLFKPSQIEVRYFVRYTNVRFSLSIEPQIPVFDKTVNRYAALQHSKQNVFTPLSKIQVEKRLVIAWLFHPSYHYWNHLLVQVSLLRLGKQSMAMWAFVPLLECKHEEEWAEGTGSRKQLKLEDCNNNIIFECLLICCLHWVFMPQRDWQRINPSV